jgi:hypothetical protein
MVARSVAMGDQKICRPIEPLTKLVLADAKFTLLLLSKEKKKEYSVEKVRDRDIEVEPFKISERLLGKGAAFGVRPFLRWRP